MHALGARIEVIGEEIAATLRQKTGAERLAKIWQAILDKMCER